MAEFWETVWWVLSNTPWYGWVWYIAALVVMALAIHSFWER